MSALQRSIASATPRDRDLRFPSPMVVSASAGSGKTYALALRITQFLLSSVVPHGSLPNIIAMTFTNAAAEEMRRRIVQFLKEAAIPHGEPTSDLTNLYAIVSMNPDQIRARAGEMLDAIFAHYDDFQVCTIDSFIARAFKASAVEAGLPADFDLVKVERPLIEAAFDRYAREASRQPHGMDELRSLTELLESTSHSSAFDWNPFARIVRGSATVLHQIASKPAEFDREDPTPASVESLHRLRSIARELQGAIQQSGLQSRNVVKEDIERILSGDWEKALRPPPKEEAVLKSRKSVPGEEVARRNIADLFARLNQERAALAIIDAATYYWPFVKALTVVSVTIEATKIAKGMFSIDDVNRHLWRSLEGGAAPTIYVTLGTHLYHFLIDEFQDTSPIQWAALKVLVENACAEDGSLYAVGDTKQSIYSFRGADWQIMHRLLEGEETVNLQPCLKATLDMNFRSDEAIIRFVESVFRKAQDLPDFGEPVRLTGLDHCAQTPVDGKRGKGHVEVLRIAKDPILRPEAETLVNLVEDAHKRNYPLRSIAILAQTNSQVLEIGGWLNQAGINFLSYSNLDLRKRPMIMEIIRLLGWLDSPIDDLAFATFILGEVFSRCVKSIPEWQNPPTTARIREFIVSVRGSLDSPLYTRFRATFPDIWNRCFAKLLARVGYLPAYDIVCQVFKTFDLFSLAPGEQIALAGLLDAVNSLEARGATSVKDLLDFANAEEGEEENEVWNLASLKQPDAVTVMTVHKAKGLQFPVLIVLLVDGRGVSDAMRMVEEDGKIRLLHVSKPVAARDPFLEEIYDNNLMLQRADSLNRLYVALTRAQHELYVVSVEGERGGFPSMVIPDCDSPLERPVKSAAEEQGPEALEIHPYVHTLQMHGESVEHARIGFIETRRGDMIHRILARIDFLDDSSAEVVKGLLAQEYISPLEHADVGRALTSFLDSDEIRPLFTAHPDSKVMNEKEFLSRTGELQRMDRIVTQGNDITVIDFKTGGVDSQASHREQVRRYLEILAEIYPDKTLRGIIAYVDRRTILRVESDGRKDAPR